MTLGVERVLIDARYTTEDVAFTAVTPRTEISLLLDVGFHPAVFVLDVSGLICGNDYFFAFGELAIFRFEFRDCLCFGRELSFSENFMKIRRSFQNEIHWRIDDYVHFLPFVLLESARPREHLVPAKKPPRFRTQAILQKKNARQAQTSGRPFGAASRLRFVRRLELILLPSRGNALRLKARGGWWKISRQ
ncbi:MAG: hypothetical protein ACI4P3_01000 [Candidatus Spyradosoma sp.]